MRAGLLTIHILLHMGELLHVIFGVDQHVRHVENGLLKIFRLAVSYTHLTLPTKRIV